MKLIHKINVLALLPLMIGGTIILVMGYSANKHTLTVEAEEQARLQAEMNGQDIRDYFVKHINVLTVLSTSQVFKSRHLTDILSQMKQWESKLPEIEALYYNEVDGTVHESTGMIFSVSDRYYFPAIQRGETVITKLIKSRATGEKIVLILVPIFDQNGRRTGALGGTIRVSQIIERVENIHFGETGFAILYDNAGSIISGASGAGIEKDKIGIDFIPQVLKKPAQNPTRLFLAGESHLVYIQQIPSTQWTLALLSKETEVLNKVRRAGFITLVMLAEMFLLATLIAFALRKTLLVPIKTLTSAQGRINNGDFSARAVASSNDELGELLRSFNAMAESLESANMLLRESEESYREIFENTGTSMILIEDDMTISMVNAEFVRNTGYSTYEINGRMKWTELVHPDELVRMIEQHRLRREISGSALPGYELRYRTKAGDQRDALLNIQLLPGTKKSVASLIDITERKKADKALRESEEQYRLLFESAGEGILLAQGDMIKFANPALAEILGYPRDIITTRPFSSFIHPDDIATVVDRHTRRMRGETVKTGYDFRILKSDGTQRLLHIISQQVSWDGMPASLSFVMDITEHRQAEEALRESEELFRSYLEYAPDGVYMSDLEGNFLYGNRKCEEIIGYRREDLVGKNFLELNLLPENSLNKAVGLLQANIAGKSTGPDEIELIIKEGRIKPVEISTNVIQRMGQRIILAFVRDITDRKIGEEEKRLLEERLQQTDKMESIGTLAGGIAHDFNNLLAGMQGYVSMILMNLKDNDPNYERLERIQDQIQSGADLTSQLLGFARGGRYQIKPSNMNEILEKTSSMFGRTKKEITIHRKSGSDLWSVEVDRGQMEQVFLNLYVNAWQAMSGGGDIYLETQNSLLNGEQALFYSVRPGKYVKITITDTGIGMDEKTKEKIFEPFFTTKGMGRGTGLGLATVYGIIKGHEGIINVESKPGHGTTFTIYLPASEKEVQKEAIPTEEIFMGTETILLIDDEKTVMEVNKELLESMGYTVYAAGSGQEGLAVYMEKKDKIDLIILDMIMPGISGGVTFDRLREINPDIKVLLSSGYSLNGEAQEIIDRGCNGFLQKPFLPEELSGKVREMLN